MDEIKSDSVKLIVTSPPYNVGKEYEDGDSFDDWQLLIKSVLNECHRVLIDGGRACINVASVCRHPYIPLYKYIIDIAFELGWTMRGTILWIKSGAGPKTSWGSWRKSTNPVLRDSHEFILVFQKGKEQTDDGQSNISAEEFMEFTRSEWYFTPEIKKIGHPAPFPDELPRRCILLYSNEGDTILDPFGGSATTFKVAKCLNRNPIIYEQNKKYIPIIEERIASPMHIQSEAHERYIYIRKHYPELYNMSKRTLLRMFKEKYGEQLPITMGRINIIHKLAAYNDERRKNQNKIDHYL